MVHLPLQLLAGPRKRRQDGETRDSQQKHGDPHRAIILSFDFDNVSGSIRLKALYRNPRQVGLKMQSQTVKIASSFWPETAAGRLGRALPELLADASLWNRHHLPILAQGSLFSTASL